MLFAVMSTVFKRRKKQQQPSLQVRDNNTREDATSRKRRKDSFVLGLDIIQKRVKESKKKGK